MTSIEWLYAELAKNNNSNNSIKERIYRQAQIWKDAKEMHKQEIVTAFYEGQEYEYQYHINNAPKFDSETYYKETFVSKGSDEALKCNCNVDSFLCQIHGTSDGGNNNSLLKLKKINYERRIAEVLLQT